MKAIVDTTYLLPTFGIGVKELNDTDLLELRRHVLQGNLQLYCLTTIWSELLGKVHREAAKHGIPLTQIKTSIKALFNPKIYKWIKTRPKTIQLAYKIRSLGHKDDIGNLLYAAAQTRGCFLLSMDIALKQFLQAKNLDTSNIKDHRQLLQELASQH